MAQIIYDPISGGDEWYEGDWSDVNEGTRYPDEPVDNSFIQAVEDEDDTNTWNTLTFSNNVGPLFVTYSSIRYRSYGPDELASGEIFIGGESLGMAAPTSELGQWRFVTSPSTGVYSGALTARLYSGTMGNHDEAGIRSLYIEMSGGEVTNPQYIPSAPGLCQEYLVPDRNRPSYINDSGNITESSVPYSAGFNFENSQGLSYYNPSGDNSFSYYIDSGRNQDDTTYLLKTGVMNPEVYYFMWQGDPLHIRPSGATLFINASGNSVDNNISIGNYYDQIVDFGLDVRVVGPTGDYKSITTLSPYQSGEFYTGYGPSGSDFSYTWTDLDVNYDKGFNVVLSPSAVNEADELGLFYGNRTEVRGYFSVDASSNDFALSEMMIFFSGECLDKNGACSLYALGGQDSSSNNDLYLQALEELNDNTTLHALSFAGSGDYADSGNLYLEAKAPVPTGNAPLYIGGKLYSTTILDTPTLYTKSISEYNEGVSLYIYGSGSAGYSNNKPLYIAGTPYPTGNTPLFIEGPNKSSGNPTLFIKNFVEDSGNINLFLKVDGEGSERIARPLYIGSAIETTGGVPLKIGSTYDSDFRSLFIKSRDYIPSGTEDMDLFIWSSLNDGARQQTSLYTTNLPDAEVSLFIKTNEYADYYEYTSLYIPGQKANNPKSVAPLFMLGNPVAFSSTPLFMADPNHIDYNNSVNLFINRSVDSTANNIPMYLHSNQFVTSGGLLYISGTISSTENNTLFIDGQGIPTGDLPLYIHGF